MASGGNITVNGGNISVDSSDDSIHCGGDMLLNGGILKLASADDAAHSDHNLTIGQNSATYLTISRFLFQKLTRESRLRILLRTAVLLSSIRPTTDIMPQEEQTAPAMEIIWVGIPEIWEQAEEIIRLI